MYIKTHFLDLNPKHVKNDPLKLKSLFTNKVKSTLYRRAEEKPKILPMRLDSAKTRLGSTNPLGRTFHTKIQSEVKAIELRQKNEQPTATQNYYKRVLEDKVFIHSKIQKRYNSASVNRQTSGYRRFKELFVIPKIRDYEHFRESVSKLSVGNEGTVRAENKKVFYNPQFILKQLKKEPNLLSAFNSVAEKNKEDFSLKNRIKKKMDNNNRTLQDFKLLKGIQNEERSLIDTEDVKRPKTCLAYNFERKFRNNSNFRYMTAKPLKNKLKETLEIKNRFQKNKKYIENDIKEIDESKIYFNKLIKIDIDDFSIFKEDFKKLEKEVSLNIKERNILNYLAFIKKFEDLRKFNKAIHYLKKIYHTSIFNDLGPFKAYVLNHLAFCLFETKNFNSSLELNKRLLNYPNITHQFISQFNTIVCCRSLRSVSHEKFFIKQYLSLARKLNENQHIFFALAHKLIFYITNFRSRKSDEILEDIKEDFSEDYKEEINFLEKLVDYNRTAEKVKPGNKNKENIITNRGCDFEQGVLKGKESFNNFKLSFNI